jgi:hypothetical protein
MFRVNRMGPLRVKGLIQKTKQRKKGLGAVLGAVLQPLPRNPKHPKHPKPTPATAPVKHRGAASVCTTRNPG